MVAMGAHDKRSGPFMMKAGFLHWTALAGYFTLIHADLVECNTAADELSDRKTRADR